MMLTKSPRRRRLRRRRRGEIVAFLDRVVLAFLLFSVLVGKFHTSSVTVTATSLSTDEGSSPPGSEKPQHAPLYPVLPTTFEGSATSSTNENESISRLHLPAETAEQSDATKPTTRPLFTKQDKPVDDSLNSGYFHSISKMGKIGWDSSSTPPLTSSPETQTAEKPLRKMFEQTSREKEKDPSPKKPEEILKRKRSDAPPVPSNPSPSNSFPSSSFPSSSSPSDLSPSDPSPRDPPSPSDPPPAPSEQNGFLLISFDEPVWHAYFPLTVDQTESTPNFAEAIRHTFKGKFESLLNVFLKALKQKKSMKMKTILIPGGRRYLKGYYMEVSQSGDVLSSHPEASQSQDLMGSEEHFLRSIVQKARKIASWLFAEHLLKKVTDRKDLLCGLENPELLDACLPGANVPMNCLHMFSTHPSLMTYTAKLCAIKEVLEHSWQGFPSALVGSDEKTKIEYLTDPKILKLALEETGTELVKLKASQVLLDVRVLCSPIERASISIKRITQKLHTQIGIRLEVDLNALKASKEGGEVFTPTFANSGEYTVWRHLNAVNHLGGYLLILLARGAGNDKKVAEIVKNLQASESFNFDFIKSCLGDEQLKRLDLESLRHGVDMGAQAQEMITSNGDQTFQGFSKYVIPASTFVNPMDYVSQTWVHTGNSTPQSSVGPDGGFGPPPPYSATQSSVGPGGGFDHPPPYSATQSSVGPGGGFGPYPPAYSATQSSVRLDGGFGPYPPERDFVLIDWSDTRKKLRRLYGGVTDPYVFVELNDNCPTRVDLAKSAKDYQERLAYVVASHIANAEKADGELLEHCAMAGTMASAFKQQLTFLNGKNTTTGVGGHTDLALSIKSMFKPANPVFRLKLDENKLEPALKRLRKRAPYRDCLRMLTEAGKLVHTPVVDGWKRRTPSVSLQSGIMAALKTNHARIPEDPYLVAKFFKRIRNKTKLQRWKRKRRASRATGALCHAMNVSSLLATCYTGSNNLSITMASTLYKDFSMVSGQVNMKVTERYMTGCSTGRIEMHLEHLQKISQENEKLGNFVKLFVPLTPYWEAWDLKNKYSDDLRRALTTGHKTGWTEKISKRFDLNSLPSLVGYLPGVNSIRIFASLGKRLMKYTRSARRELENTHSNDLHSSFLQESESCLVERPQFPAPSKTSPGSSLSSNWESGHIASSSVREMLAKQSQVFNTKQDTEAYTSGFEIPESRKARFSFLFLNETRKGKHRLREKTINVTIPSVDVRLIGSSDATMVARLLAQTLDSQHTRRMEVAEQSGSFSFAEIDKQVPDNKLISNILRQCLERGDEPDFEVEDQPIESEEAGDRIQFAFHNALGGRLPRITVRLHGVFNASQLHRL